MSVPRSAETVVVGAGVSGILVARELVRAGHEVLLIERGGRMPHGQQLEQGRHELDVPTAKHTHQNHPDTPYNWDYLFGVGGSTLHWGGVTPRFLPSDFELRSRYGVGVDWPIGYDELEPFYVQAERALGVSASDKAPYPRSGSAAAPPHPYAPVDEVVAPLLRPYYRLPQARPTESIGGRSACCASGRCTLCPVDARYSALHTLADAKLEEQPGFTLLDQTVVARLRLQGDRVVGVECLNANGERRQIAAKRVVLAASGLENPGLLLRSGLDGEDVGRWLNDHRHKVFHFEVDKPVRIGAGTTIATGISYAFADGDWRSERASAIVYPENRGEFMLPAVKDAVVSGRGGKRELARLRDRFQRTVLLDTLTEDLPMRERRIELSPDKDPLGLPYNRVTYPDPSPYTRRAYEHLVRELERRLAPLGARLTETHDFGGAHLLGTARMGESSGVVDPQQRHHQVSNLYVTGGSSFPTYSAAHPTLTIAALALRLGQHLVSER